MKKLIVVTMLITAFASLMSAASANENHCKGDASHSTPPAPNYPTYVRNIVWRNTRELCLAEQSQAVNHPQASSIKKPVEQKVVN